MADVDATKVTVRGSWKVDDETGELVEVTRADAYAEQVERDRRFLPRPSIVKS